MSEPMLMWHIHAAAKTAEVQVVTSRGAIAAAYASSFIEEYDARIREVKAEALREAAALLSAETEGAGRIRTATWPAHDRDIYSLAIEEAESALEERADRIESQETP